MKKRLNSKIKVQLMLNYSKTYRMCLINQDLLFLAVTSQPPSPALTVGKSGGESHFIIGSVDA